MTGVPDPKLLASLAVVFGTVGLLFPATVSRTTRRAEQRLLASVRGRSDVGAVLDSSSRVQLTRLLAGWGVLVGLGGLLAPSAYFQIVVVGYTLVFLGGLWYVVLRSVVEGKEDIAVR